MHRRTRQDRLGGKAATIWQAEGVLMELLAVGPQSAGQRLRRVSARSRADAVRGRRDDCPQPRPSGLAAVSDRTEFSRSGPARRHLHVAGRRQPVLGAITRSRGRQNVVDGFLAQGPRVTRRHHRFAPVDQQRQRHHGLVGTRRESARLCGFHHSPKLTRKYGTCASSSVSLVSSRCRPFNPLYGRQRNGNRPTSALPGGGRFVLPFTPADQ